jgi:threonine dehydrogenase-like Zn-dependent dehydrogenase
VLKRERRLNNTNGAKHIDVLLKYVIEGKVQLDDIITHRLPLSNVAHAYKIFKEKEEDCVKIVLNPWG